MNSHRSSSTSAAQLRCIVTDCNVLVLSYCLDNIVERYRETKLIVQVRSLLVAYSYVQVGSVAKWLACWTQAQKGPGSNRSRDAVG